MRTALILLLTLPLSVEAGKEKSKPLVDVTLVPLYDTYREICRQPNLSSWKMVGYLKKVCKVVMASETCRNIPPEHLLNCDTISTKRQTSSMDFVLGCTKGAFNSFVVSLKMVWDFIKDSWASESGLGEQGTEYLAFVRSYYHAEYKKNVSRSSRYLAKADALFYTVSLNSINEVFAEMTVKATISRYENFGCLNFQAKTEAVCQYLADYIIPPATLKIIDDQKDD